jgi:hypothetical protein
MHLKEKITIIIYIAVVLATVLYPPFNLEVQGLLVRSEYSWLWRPIMYGTEYGRTPLGTVDLPRVIIQLLGTTLVAGAALLFFRYKKK